ncbi:hypothetical protein HJC23_005027 [Cyclotella cryptica]|uniref:Prephenate dehydratase n=1 Tax=Cyclotella cryptica TaxID=29204 RepID=A0ABD3QEL3_9STRA|eukprot:CCRYP_006237-RA/>CCRYP_006237-RA protein AED:0.20 eAED:0.20 QI:130/1/1/1/1/1/2/700/756
MRQLSCIFAAIAASIQSTSAAPNFPSSPRTFPPRSKGGNKSILLPRGALNEIRSVLESQPPNTPTILQRGGATVSPPQPSSDPSPPKPIRIAFQGEAGAYSEKSLRELLGPHVLSIPRPNFEACYRAVASGEADYAMIPIENSLGGSIHENYDLMLRYDLTVVAEHDFRVRHCLLVKPGVEMKDVRYAISHPQALSQCDNYLRGRGITPVTTYDTAGSAKMIRNAILEKEGKFTLPEGCTPENTAAIASDLAGKTFGLECKEEGIEDDDSNFTRFLLLGRRGVVQYLNKKIPSKTSLVFTLPNSAGALYKALACFSLRDVDMSKIESRPMSAGLLNYLRFRNTVTQLGGGRGAGATVPSSQELPRFRYCFYLDILESELDERVQNALHHLREQSDYCRILGSYPAKSRLVGPVAEAVEALKAANAGKSISSEELRLKSLPSDEEDTRQLNIGFVGYGSFGQYLSKKMSAQHKLRCVDPFDKSKEAEENGVDYFPTFEMSNFLQGLDVVIITVPMIELEETVESLPSEKLRKKLIVEACPLNVYPRTVLSRILPADADILCTNPMFGPAIMHNKETDAPLDGLPFVYEKVRISDTRRADCFLSIFERARCQMVEMSAEDHDAYVADAEFVTHLTGRLLDRNLLPVTPVSSREYAALCDVADMTANDTFDLFYGMFRYNDRAKELLNKMRDNLASVERKLAAKEAYLAASLEMKNTDRQKLLAECRMLLREVAKSSGKAINEATIEREIDTSSVTPEK